MPTLKTNTTPTLEIQVTLRSGDADPTPGNTTLALCYYKDGHSKDGQYWTGSAWQAGTATFASAQADGHAHRYVCPVGVLSAADMAGGRLTLRAVAATVIGSDKEWDIEQPGWLDDAVYISATNGAAGTTAPLGTRGNPSSNLPDTRTIANANGVKWIVFLDSQSYTLDQDYPGFLFEGEQLANINMNAKDLGGSTFRDLMLNGTGGPTIYDCVLIGVTYTAAFIYRSLFAGTNTINPASGQAFLVDCIVADYSGKTLNFSGPATAIRLGGTGIFAGLTTADTIELMDLKGVFEIASSCTGGTINISGIIDITDNSGAGCTVNLTDGVLNLTGVNAEADAALSGYDGPTKTEMDAAFLAQQGADGDTLETLSDQLDFCTPVGQRQITIHVQDELGAALSYVEVSIFGANNVQFKTRKRTNPNGDYAVNLDDASYKLRMCKDLYGFNSPETMTVTKDETFTFVGTAFTAPTPSAPDKCVIYGVVRDAGEVIVADADVTAYAITPQAVGDIVKGERRVTVKTNASGYFQLELGKGTRVYFAVPDAGIRITFVVPDVPNKKLAELL